MKKLSILSLLLITCGCTSVLDVKVEWKQVGTNCVYTEEAGNGYYSYTGKRDFDPLVTKTITYPDMQCSKIIESEIKSGINKNQTVHISRARFGN